MSFHRYSKWTLGALLIVAPGTSIQCWAQSRAFDKIIVELPENTWVGGQKLAAGKYDMRQLPSAGNASNVILVSEKTDRRFSASAISERSVRGIPYQQTKVILQRVGNDYYLDRIWVAGKQFGYRFALPDAVLARIEELQQPLTLSATFTMPPAQAEVTPPPAPAAPPEQPREEAQATPPPPAPPQAEEQPAPAPAPGPHELPKTASDWPLALVGGLGSLAAAFALRVSGRFRM
ncbi:MAG: hypothetical protein JO307_00705 [Bryobacterales bacterium]|nr:hypothetical protein [Bryobacterales bacterium]MBV9396782.1 hypothetical protein [Bryobacterales bacterium]